MTTIKPAIVAAAILALAACDNPRTRAGTPATTISPAATPGSTATTGVSPVSPTTRLPTAPTPGDPTTPTASRPQGASPSSSTGGGTPIPTRPGGVGGVGSGNQPAFGGSSGR